MRNIDLQRIASTIIATRMVKQTLREKCKQAYHATKRHAHEVVTIAQLAVKEELPR